MCSLEHYASSCPKDREATPKQRFSFVKNHNLCFNCLGKDHMELSCPSKNRCSKHDCSTLHHTTLHEAFNQPHARPQPDRESRRNTFNALRGTERGRQQPIRSPPTDAPTRPSQFNAFPLNGSFEKFPKDLFSVFKLSLFQLSMMSKSLIPTPSLIQEVLVHTSSIRSRKP